MKTSAKLDALASEIVRRELKKAAKYNPMSSPTVKFSEDGRTWGIWVIYHSDQQKECEACLRRLENLYPELKFRMALIAELT
jgi:hypothetical protein